eukprot:NODE_1791_length_1406_cov_28.511422_g1620_i0.p1 GENE.NODE_1791_length_1406_cov_28.511422_g1620_i0~~NODE_1791_length_1406_cov_28.511422_g1620_i0.p1  ORF type:complete len:409 (+),score=72.72 NODE_1791_length_1406_cov_28.511422_g1620_i0:127-1353(+)
MSCERTEGVGAAASSCDDGDDLEPVCRIRSEDIEAQLARMESWDEKEDVGRWYSSCMEMASQVLSIVEELQRSCQELEEAESRESEEDDEESGNHAGSSRESDDGGRDDDPGMQQQNSQPFAPLPPLLTEDDVRNNPNLCYICFGEEFDQADALDSIFMDYDLNAEQILDRKRIDGVVMYKVLWKGGPEDGGELITWHADDELECRNLILKFEAERRKPREPSKRKVHESTTSGTRKLGKRAQAKARREALEQSCPSGGGSVPTAGITPVTSKAPKLNVRLGSSEKKVLYHGTTWECASGIIDTGFRLPQARSGRGLGPVRPHMFGKGIYFTSSREKASHFGNTLLVCEVTTGRHLTASGAEYDLTLPGLRDRGYDSVYAPPGCGGNVFDEYVVYHPGQVRVVGYLRR